MLLKLIPAYACVLFLQVAGASVDQITDELDELIKTLKPDEIRHSGKTRVTRTDPCVQISAHDVSIPKALSRKAKKMLELDPSSKFNIAYCETNKSDNQKPTACAVESVCTTVYRWKKARTRSMIFGLHNIYVDDHVLVPVSCMCVLGQEQNGVVESTPIIIL